MKRTLSLILAMLMITVALASCQNSNGGDTTTEPPSQTKAPAETSEEREDTTKAEEPETTKAPVVTTPAETEPPEIPTPEIADGLMVINYDFDTLPDTEGNDAVAALLGWQIRNKSDGAITDNTAVYSIEGGKLKVINYNDGAIDGGDSYFLIAGDDYMKPAAVGSYTIQYDVNYLATAKPDRYVCLIANYGGCDIYNSFHLRARGTANNQVRFSSWSTYDIKGSDFYAAGTDNDDTGSSIANKLYGLTYDSSASPLIGKDLTIRWVLDAEAGPSAYIRDNSSPTGEFVCVSKADAGAGAMAYWGLLDSYAIALKTGGKIDSYVDNIKVWTGTGDEPLDATTTAYEAAISDYLKQVQQ